MTTSDSLVRGDNEANEKKKRKVVNIRHEGKEKEKRTETEEDEIEALFAKRARKE